MDELIFAGNKYISSKRAGKLAGYTTDYLGQMCRADKMDCRFVGRNWYINERELERQKKDFKKEQARLPAQASKSREIEYRKIELEPMYYSNDERSNYPEINKVIHNDIEKVEEKKQEEEFARPNFAEQNLGGQAVPVHIKRYAPHPLQRQERQIIERQPIVPQQARRGLSMTLPRVFVLILFGILLVVSTLTLEQVISYSSDTNTDIETKLQLANITKAL